MIFSVTRYLLLSCTLLRYISDTLFLAVLSDFFDVGYISNKVIVLKSLDTL